MNTTEVTVNDIDMVLAERVDLITVDAKLSECIDAYRWLMDVQRSVVERIAQAKPLVIDALKVSGDDGKPAKFVAGCITYSVGRKTEWKAASILDVVKALAEKGGLEAVARCIAANGIKHGQVKTELDDKDQFNKLFVMDKSDTLVLNAVDERFVKPKAAIERSAD